MKEKAKRKQHTMSELDFVVKYPHTDAALDDIYPFENITSDGKNMLRKYMSNVS